MGFGPLPGNDLDSSAALRSGGSDIERSKAKAHVRGVGPLITRHDAGGRW